MKCGFPCTLSDTIVAVTVNFLLVFDAGKQKLDTGFLSALQETDRKLWHHRDLTPAFRFRDRRQMCTLSIHFTVFKLPYSEKFVTKMPTIPKIFAIWGDGEGHFASDTWQKNMPLNRYGNTGTYWLSEPQLSHVSKEVSRSNYCGDKKFSHRGWHFRRL